MRAFVAVELPDSLRQEVAALQSQLRKTNADVKWVEVDNLHLTLKFLGEIEESQRSAISGKLSGICKGHEPFEIDLEGIGAFPRTTSPRVIWVGVTKGKEELERIARDVEEACRELGFPSEERPFSAHLTIGRTRSSQGIGRLVKELQVAEFRATTPAPIDRLILFQSTLSPHGPTYTPLAEFPLTE